MPTNDDRRQIAERLRSRRKQMESERPPASKFLASFIYLVEIGRAVSLGEKGDLFNRLADLIEPEPERTCGIDMPVIDWETGETDYRCSSCGFSADPQDWAETYVYCPHCGAKVVE